jgi:hypothetical protein
MEIHKQTILKVITECESLTNRNYHKDWVCRLEIIY